MTLLTIPFQAFHAQFVYLSPFQPDKYGKWMARFSYQDDIHFTDVPLLTPALRVVDYQPATSRLRLDVSQHPAFAQKLATFLDFLVHTFHVHQSLLLHTEDHSAESIRELFYPFLESNILHLYVYPTLPLLGGGIMGDIQSGDLLRCVLRFHGVSQPMKDVLRLRLHHTLPAIWKVRSLIS